MHEISNDLKENLISTINMSLTGNFVFYTLIFIKMRSEKNISE